jgi:hypothetical protein
MVRFAYLDESGDVGFRFGRGSTDHFVVAVVMIDDPVPLQGAIDDLRAVLSIPLRAEFRFNKTNKTNRKEFLKVVRNHDVVIRATFAHKALAVGQPDFLRIPDWYNYMFREALTHHCDLFDDTTVILDERSPSKDVQLALNAYLRQGVNTPESPRRIRDIRHEPSVRNNLIQTADMIAGSIAASYMRGEDSYIQIVRAKIDDIVSWDGIIRAP